MAPKHVNHKFYILKNGLMDLQCFNPHMKLFCFNNARSLEYNEIQILALLFCGLLGDI